MPGRSLDQLVMEKLGICEMTILRLQWKIEDLQAELKAAQEQIPAPSHDEGKSDE